LHVHPDTVWKRFAVDLHAVKNFVNFDVEKAFGVFFRDSKSTIKKELDMWGGIVGLIIQLIAGGVGGNIAGSALKQYDLGAVGNTIAGVIGGGVGAQIIGALVGGGAGAATAGTGGLDIGSIIGQIASGGVGGGILMVIVGLIKQAMGGQKAT
jgi:hypothetical protein